MHKYLNMYIKAMYSICSHFEYQVLSKAVQLSFLGQSAS